MKHLIVNDYVIGGGAESVYNQYVDFFENIESDSVMRFHSENDEERTILRYIFNIKYFLKMKRLLLNNPPEFIWVHNYYHILSPSILLAIKLYATKSKVIYIAHDYHLVCPNPSLMGYKHKKPFNLDEKKHWSINFLKSSDFRGWKYSVLRKLQWLIAYKILNLHDVFDKVVSPSSYLKDTLQLHYPKLDIEIIRNPIDFEIERVRQTITVGGKRDAELLFVGRLSYEKGLQQFIQLLDAISFDKVQCLKIIWDGPELNVLKEIVSTLCADDKVKFLGRLDTASVYEEIQATDCMVLPSICLENAPITVVEAAINEKPIILNEIGSLSSFGRQVGNAFYFTMEDRQSLIDCLGVITGGASLLKVNVDDFSKATFLRKIIKITGQK